MNFMLAWNLWLCGAIRVSCPFFGRIIKWWQGQNTFWSQHHKRTVKRKVIRYEEEKVCQNVSLFICFGNRRRHWGGSSRKFVQHSQNWHSASARKNSFRNVLQKRCWKSFLKQLRCRRKWRNSFLHSGQAMFHWNWRRPLRCWRSMKADSWSPKNILSRFVSFYRCGLKIGRFRICWSSGKKSWERMILKKWTETPLKRQRSVIFGCQMHFMKKIRSENFRWYTDLQAVLRSRSPVEFSLE